MAETSLVAADRCLIIYGVTTESLQLFVPHRTARVMDAVENILGIALGTVVYWMVLRLKKADVVRRRRWLKRKQLEMDRFPQHYQWTRRPSTN